MLVSGTVFLLNPMNDIFSCRFFRQLPRLDGSKTKSSNRRADGVSSPNLACLPLVYSLVSNPALC
jgi:hypothetical protein